MLRLFLSRQCRVPLCVCLPGIVRFASRSPGLLCVEKRPLALQTRSRDRAASVCSARHRFANRLLCVEKRPLAPQAGAPPVHLPEAPHRARHLLPVPRLGVELQGAADPAALQVIPVEPAEEAPGPVGARGVADDLLPASERARPLSQRAEAAVVVGWLVLAVQASFREPGRAARAPGAPGATPRNSPE